MTVPTTGRRNENGGDVRDAVFLVDKPSGWTSFDVVNKIRSASGIRRVGHAGTLDPLATGLLIVCTGRNTKTLASYTGYDKTYSAVLTLGGTTESYDAAMPVMERQDISGITEEDIRRVLGSFLGPQLQIPPMWSAVKVRGRRLYRYARKGETVPRPPREIEIQAIGVDRIELPEVHVTVTCSKGTYIRTLAHDIGTRLGCGAYLSRLRRTAIGPFRIEDADSIEEVVNRVSRVTAQ